MPDVSLVILYVANPPASAAFYAALLHTPIVDQSDNFCLLPLSGGMMLGLWARGDVSPAATGLPGASELTLMAADRADLEARLTAWRHAGIAIAQPVTAADFGLSFVALDPDGHRIRVMVAAAP